MPITLQFGPWAPDLANDPVAIPDTQGPVPVPCADCLNVFYANGSYQSIPSPAIASIDGNAISALNAQALQAFSYFDNVEQQETVFAGTQAGISQLTSSGQWNVIPFLTNQSAAMAGQSFSLNAGNFVNSTRLKPVSFGFSTGHVSNFVTGTSIVAGVYSYKYTAGPDNKPVTYTVTSTGFASPAQTANPFGTCKNPSLLAGGTLLAIYDGMGLPTGSVTTMTVSVAVDPTQSAFTTLVTNGKSFPSAAATYSYTASNKQAVWSWASPYAPFGFASGSTYTVVLK